MGGAETASLLTRSIARRRRGLLAAHQGDAVSRPVGRAAGHQHDRGRHRGQGRRAPRALPGRGRPAPGVLARLRADARARRAHGRAPARRLVRDRHGRRARASSSRWRSPTSIPRRSSWRTSCAGATRRTWTRPPASPRSCAAARPSCTPRSPTSCSCRPPGTRSTCGSSASSGCGPPWPSRCGSATRRSGVDHVRLRGERPAVRRGRPAFAQDLALRAATAVQNARLYAAQQRVAHTLQASLLPETLPRCRAGTSTRPTRRASAAPTWAATSTTSCRSRAAT